MGLKLWPAIAWLGICVTPLFPFGVSSAANAEGSTPPVQACTSASPVDMSNGIPEVRGTATGEAQFWALLFYTPPLAAGSDVKIVFRMTGSGPITLRAKEANGTEVSPVSGPQLHAGSNWDRPGDEWGTIWVFPTPGCWQIHARRGETTAEMTIAVTPAAHASPQPIATAPPPPHGPCPQAGEPTVLRVARSNAFPQNPPRAFSSPLKQTSTSAKKVRKLYTAVCSSPPVPVGEVINCPMDVGVSYHLIFRRGTEKLLSVRVDASGCQMLHAKPGSTYRTTPTFWTRLGKVLNLAPARLHVP
jgi:hypothetical protein